jgi:hypothetical protein
MKVSEGQLFFTIGRNVRKQAFNLFWVHVHFVLELFVSFLIDAVNGIDDFHPLGRDGEAVDVLLVGKVGVVDFVEGEVLCTVLAVEFDADVQAQDAVLGFGVKEKDLFVFSHAELFGLIVQGVAATFSDN